MVGGMLGRNRKQSLSPVKPQQQQQQQQHNQQEELHIQANQNGSSQSQSLHPSYGAPQDGLRAFKLTPESEFDAFLPSRPNSIGGNDIALPVMGAGSRSGRSLDLILTGFRPANV